MAHPPPPHPRLARLDNKAGREARPPCPSRPGDGRHLPPHRPGHGHPAGRDPPPALSHDLCTHDFMASVERYPSSWGFWGSARSTCLYESRYPEVPVVLTAIRGYLLTEAMTCRRVMSARWPVMLPSVLAFAAARAHVLTHTALCVDSQELVSEEQIAENLNVLNYPVGGERAAGLKAHKK